MDAWDAWDAGAWDAWDEGAWDEAFSVPCDVPRDELVAYVAYIACWAGHKVEELPGRGVDEGDPNAGVRVVVENPGEVVRETRAAEADLRGTPSRKVSAASSHDPFLVEGGKA